MSERADDAAPEPGTDPTQREAVGYRLGIDVGTTCVSAAVRRGDGPGAAEVVPLGTAGPTVPGFTRYGAHVIGPELSDMP